MLTIVTGAAGFVGAALARRMAQVGYPGTVRLDVQSAAQLDRLVEVALAQQGAIDVLVCNIVVDRGTLISEGN